MHHNQPVLVLGMHRSGTSCLAGCLEAAGLYLGSVNTAAPFNKKGNREPEHIRDLHDALLERNGASWNAPPPGPLEWPDALLEELKLKTNDLAQAKQWGVKDPRSAFCLEGWKRLFAPRFVVSYRHPSAVVASLVRRSISWKRPMEQSDAYALWAAYNRRILDEIRGGNVPIVRFGVRPEDYAKYLRIICHHLGLDFETAMSFYDADLDTNSSNISEMPADCLPIWQELEDTRERMLSQFQLS